jgi:hypothetical protein
MRLRVPSFQISKFKEQSSEANIKDQISKFREKYQIAKSKAQILLSPQAMPHLNFAL